MQGSAASTLEGKKGVCVVHPDARTYLMRLLSLGQEARRPVTPTGCRSVAVHLNSRARMHAARCSKALATIGVGSFECVRYCIAWGLVAVHVSPHAHLERLSSHQQGVRSHEAELH